MADEKKSKGMDLTSAVFRLLQRKSNKAGMRTGVKPSTRGKAGNGNMFK